MPTLYDDEFGEISITKHARSTRASARFSPSGTLKISVPKHMPLFLVRTFLNISREKIRKISEQQRTSLVFFDGQPIGKTHTLIVKKTEADFSKIIKYNTSLIVSLSAKESLDNPVIQQKIHAEVLKIFRTEAKKHLPQRLMFHAKKMKTTYAKIRFSHASSRWGSCSSSGTISLNIALMKLPFAMIDYVLIHELAHTFEMNHSKDFWHIVRSYCPEYKKIRAELKNQHPGI